MREKWACNEYCTEFITPHILIRTIGIQPKTLLRFCKEYRIKAGVVRLSLLIINKKKNTIITIESMT